MDLSGSYNNAVSGTGHSALFRGLFAISFLISLVSSACRKETPRFAKELGISVAIEKHVLSNGLQVILAEDHTVPIVSYQTWFKVGSVDEQIGMTGLAHLFEHLLFKGTKKFGGKAFFQELESKGAEVNAYTTRDFTVYYETFVPRVLDRVLEMEADRMENLILDEATLQTERQVVFEERRLGSENSPGGKMQEALWALAFRRHPYRWPVIGVFEDLEQITVGTLAEFYRTYYQPSNAVIVAVGDFKASELLVKIKKFYGKIKSKPRPPRKILAEPEQKEERRLVLYDEVASERFTQAYPITAASDEDSYAIDVLANILFEGTSSRAYRRLVKEQSLLLGVSGTSFTPTYPGLFLISGMLKGGERVAQAEEELSKLIGEVQKKGVTEEEVQRAVRQLTVQLVDSVRTPYGLGQLIGTVMMIFGDPARFSEDLAKYMKVTPEAVQRVAEQYLIPNHRSVVELRPRVKESHLKNPLRHY